MGMVYQKRWFVVQERAASLTFMEITEIILTESSDKLKVQLEISN